MLANNYSHRIMHFLFQSARIHVKSLLYSVLRTTIALAKRAKYNVIAHSII